MESKLTPTQLRFLIAAAAPGARVLKVSPLSRAAYYLVGGLKLQEKLGDNLRSLRLIERDDTATGTIGKRPYKITELGRKIMSYEKIARDLKAWSAKPRAT